MINPNLKTLADLPFHIAGRFPRRAILRHSMGDAFIDTSGHDFLEHVRDLSLGLGELGVELRVAGDGEILARGPNIMRGYYNRPLATVAAAGGAVMTGQVALRRTFSATDPSINRSTPLRPWVRMTIRSA